MPRAKREAGVVYFAVVPRRRVMKIGVTSDVVRRLRTLGEGAYGQLRLLCALHYPNRRHAERLEQSLHDIFRADRVRPKAKKCEWLHITPRLRELVLAIRRGDNVAPQILADGDAARDAANSDWCVKRSAYIAARRACWAKYGHEFVKAA